MFVFKDKQQYHAEAHLKNDTDADSLPPLISVVMTDSKHYIDGTKGVGEQLGIILIIIRHRPLSVQTPFRGPLCVTTDCFLCY